MKKVFFGLVATGFIMLSSFTNIDVVDVGHYCNYNMYNAKGKLLGQWETYVPDGVSCSDSKAVNYAIASYNAYH
jgi:hypothetical protein